jgi:Tfp pilus assembly protein PilF/predicted Zn-dependent protease with MMP-like domain
MADSDPNVTDVSARGPMDQFTAHLDRGWDLLHRGDLRGAEMSAEKSLELDAQSPEAHNLLGYVKAAQGNAEEAIEHYRQAIALDDTFVEAMLNAAEVLIHPLHDFDAALGMIEEALDFAENDDEIADALLLKYDAYMHQGDKDNAARVVAALPKGPFESARLDFLVGRAQLEIGNGAAALPLLQSAVTREPTYGDAHHALALAYEAQGDARAMVAAFLRAREADLAQPPVFWALSREAFEERVRETLARLPKPLAAALEDAHVIVTDLPGAEVVADGVDPRAAVLLDSAQRPPGSPTSPTSPTMEPKATRVFVYQRNAERAAEDASELNDELYALIEDEVCATFPELAPHAIRSDDLDDD